MEGVVNLAGSPGGGKAGVAPTEAIGHGPPREASRRGRRSPGTSTAGSSLVERRFILRPSLPLSRESPTICSTPPEIRRTKFLRPGLSCFPILGRCRRFLEVFGRWSRGWLRKMEPGMASGVGDGRGGGGRGSHSPGSAPRNPSPGTASQLPPALWAVRPLWKRGGAAAPPRVVFPSGAPAPWPSSATGDLFRTRQEHLLPCRPRRRG